jgi:hypothetical protein
MIGYNEHVQFEEHEKLHQNNELKFQLLTS